MEVTRRERIQSLIAAPRDLLAAIGEELLDDLSAPAYHGHSSPGLPLLLRHDFVEIYGGSGRVSAAAQDLGLVVAPPLDLDASQYCFHMIESGRFGSFLTEPPCTTFSAAAYPASRPYAEPNRFEPGDPRTKRGNLLAFRSFLLLRHGRRHHRPCGKEQPRLSKMAWLRAWKALLELGFEESIVASCQFGSPHRKEFRFLLYMLDAAKFEGRCPGGHSHIGIEGKYTKASAVYTLDLAKHIALHFWYALRRLRIVDEDLDASGFESVVTNDILTTRQWRVRKVWHWKRKSHSNVLESNAALEIVKDVAFRFSAVRVNLLVDSRVAKGALAKGRSTSWGLQRSCKSSAALQICSDIYIGWNFAPTRLNIADDPTRDVAIRDAGGFCISEWFSLRELQKLHFKGLSEVAANWTRLMILVFLLVELQPLMMLTIQDC